MAVLIVAGMLLLLPCGVIAIARVRWQAASAALAARVERACGPQPGRFDGAALDALPAPVSRYLRAVLPRGAPRVLRARVSQRGEFLVDPAREGWRPFVATQRFATRPPGFVWDARIRVAPGVAVHVRDAFVDGEGSMRASFMGLRRLAQVEGTPEIAAGALHRYLAEAMLFPTALLPGGGVTWDALDDSHARATLTAGGTTVSLDFHFGKDGLVDGVFTPVRSRDVGGRGVPTPWRGRWWAYEEHGGMRVPTRGEAEWVLPEGPQVYWRGHVAGFEYDHEE